MNEDDRFLELPLVVLDVETTGLEPKDDRIIEIALIHMQGSEVTERYSTLVNPDQEIPDEVQRLTGIEPSELAGAPRFAEIAEEVARRLEGRIFVAYNLAFDRAFISEELARAGHELVCEHFIDPLVFVRELHKNEGSKRLSAVAERLGIPLASAHRAADDAEAAGRVLYAILGELPDRFGDLLMLQQQWELQQKNEMAGWKGDRSGAIDEGIGQTIDRGNALGPAYIYGDDSDPVRAMFSHLPDAGTAARRLAAAG